MHIYDETTKISLRVDALSNNKPVQEFFTKQDGNRITCTIPVSDNDKLSLKASYIAGEQTMLDWDYYVDGICRFHMYSQSEAKAWKSLNKEFNYCYDVKNGDRFITDCSMIVERLPGKIFLCPL